MTTSAATSQSAVHKAAPSAAAAAQEPLQYLTFVLGSETFAIGILCIKEIIEFSGLTTVPMMPACIRGVINLRGSVVPVLDLSARFGRALTVATRRTCIVIVEVEADGVRQDIGVIVDAVNEVLEIAGEDIEPAPAFGTLLRPDLIRGMGKVDGRFVIILDTDRVLSQGDIEAAGSSAGALPAAGILAATA
jgi:purine-binding chemotaxis protein CheW